MAIFESDASTVLSNYYVSLGFAWLFVVMLYFSWLFSKSKKLSVSTLVCLLGVISLCFILRSVLGQYYFNRFVSATYEPSESRVVINLVNGSQRSIPLSELDNVKFGKGKKTNEGCYITLYLNNGEKIRSGISPKSVDTCKQISRSLNQLL